jgi:hypothetical protein
MEKRIKEEFPALFITLVSVLIGLVFADLVSEAHARMMLWPLNLETLRTWGQLFSNATCGFAVWVYYTHFGVSRDRVPTMIDSLIPFAVPTPLLIATATIGRADFWPWLYFAGAFLLISLFTAYWFAQTLQEEHPGFARLNRLNGSLAVYVIGAPIYAALGWLDQHGWLSPWMQLFVAFSPVPPALLATHIFLRDWRLSVAEASA